jgi:probable phosphoglycerate mutase
MRIYLIRHASPDYETDTLTPAGREEGRALVTYLKTLGVDEIYASPYGRTRETAQIAGDALGLRVQVEEWARELPEEFITLFNQALLDSGDGSERASALRHWESWPAFAVPIVASTMARIGEGADRLLEQHGLSRREGGYYVKQESRREGGYCVKQENHKRLAIFTHMGVVQACLAHVLQAPLPFVWSGFHVYPASITTILFEEHAPGMVVARCAGMSDVAYLSAAGLQPNPIGLSLNGDS